MPLFRPAEREGPETRFEPQVRRPMEILKFEPLSRESKGENMFNRIILCSAIIISLFSSSWSATISGSVLDAKNGKPLPDVNVLVTGTDYGTASRDGGFYTLTHLPRGKYTLTVRMIGYKVMESAIHVKSDTTIDFYLQPEPVQFDPILVSATRTDHRQSQVTVSTEIWTEKKIRETAGTTAGEVLEGTGGLYFKSYDHLAGIRIPSIRGSNPEQVLVLLDDMPLNGIQGGGVDLNNIPVSALEQIEIVRGGYSAIYGSDAIGGVIHLISRTPFSAPDYKIGVHSSIGSFGLQTEDLSYTDTADKLHYLIHYNHNQTRGNFSYTPSGVSDKSTRENNDISGNALFTKAQYPLNAQNRIQMLFQILDSERGVSGSLFYPSPTARRNETRRMISFQIENQLSDKVRLRHLIFNQNYVNRYREPGGWTPADDRHTTCSSGYQLQAQVQTHASLQWIGGAEFQGDELESTLFSKKQRKEISLYLQGEWTQHASLTGVPAMMKLLPAIRYDSYEHMGDQVSPKVGALIGLGSNGPVAFRANWSRSYRAPSFNDLYWPADFFSKGNPDLEAETGCSYDVGISLRRSGSVNSLFESTYFNNRIDNLILWASDAFYIWSPQNIGRARIQGLENRFSVAAPDNRISFTVAYTRMNAEDETGATVRQLIYRPKNKIDLNLGTEWFGIYLGVACQWIDSRYADSENMVRLDPYSLVHSKLGKDIVLNHYTVELAFQVLNLLDKSIVIVDGYPSPGRELRFSLGLKY
jgi:vitamin B12 transporter